jgi:hypothetical protein
LLTHQSALKGYREAFYPPRKSPTPPARTPSPVRSEDDDNDAGRPDSHTRERSPTSTARVSYQRARQDPDDDEDAEEAMEEMLRQQAEEEAGSGNEQRAQETSRNPEPLFTPGEPDDEELAALLEMEDDL